MATVAALIAFVVLPWFIDGGVTVSGIVVLVSGTSSLAPEAGAALAQIQWALPLIPAGLILVGLGLAADLSRRSARSLGLARAPGRPGRRGLLHPVPRP